MPQPEIYFGVGAYCRPSLHYCKCCSPLLWGANSAPQIPQLDLWGHFKVGGGREGKGKERKQKKAEYIPKYKFVVWPSSRVRSVLINHPGQLSLAIPSWVCAMSTGNSHDHC